MNVWRGILAGATLFWLVLLIFVLSSELYYRAACVPYLLACIVGGCFALARVEAGRQILNLVFHMTLTGIGLQFLCLLYIFWPFMAAIALSCLLCGILFLERTAASKLLPGSSRQEAATAAGDCSS